MQSKIPVVIRGKCIDATSLEIINQLLNEHRQKTRTSISHHVCELLNWRQPNGKFQDVACREILRRLEAMRLIRLPAPIHDGHNGSRMRERLLELPLDDDLPMVEGAISPASQVSLEPVTHERRAKIWRGLVARYHYLGYKSMVGRSLKYFIYLDGRMTGVISWGSAAWKLGLRDSFIGWDETTRIKNLHFIAGNHRFLILPWVKVKNLASHVLARAAKEAAKDWERIYGVKLYLLESFVDPAKFKGTCYKAANWIYLGQSKGASKSGNSYHWHGQRKDIYVMPLAKYFRQRLCQI